MKTSHQNLALNSFSPNVFFETDPLKLALSEAKPNLDKRISLQA